MYHRKIAININIAINYVEIPTKNTSVQKKPQKMSKAKILATKMLETS